MKKAIELIIKISLFMLLVASVLAPVLLAAFVSLWFMFGWIAVPVVAASLIDYSEKHRESYFLN